MFSHDSDLLAYEPTILAEATFAAQTLLTGTGALANNVLTISAGSLVDSGVRAGHVVVLGEPRPGCLPILSIDPPAKMSLGTLAAGWDDASPVAASLNAAGSPTFAVRTFDPQRAIVDDLLLRAAGIESGDASAVLNPDALKRASVLGTLQIIYAALATLSDEGGVHHTRSNVYGKLFRRSMRATSVRVNHRGVAQRRDLNTLTMTRG